MTAAPPQSSGTTMKTPVITENAVALNHEILEALKALQVQNRRLMKLQEASYKWQLQHHQNLKKIMNALRHLGEVLQEKWGIAPYPIQILEDPEILAGVQDEGLLPEFPAAKETDKNTLHCFVLKHRDDPYSLQEALLGITVESFETLQADSAEILVPISCAWMEDEDSARRGIAAAYILEIGNKFPSIFGKEHNRKHVERCLRALESNSPERFSTLESQDIAKLKTFLSSQLGINPSKKNVFRDC